MENTISTLKSEIDKQTLKMEELKTTNNTIIDKQIESQQKLVNERNQQRINNESIRDLKLKIEEYDTSIKELEKNIENEKEQHVITKSSMEQIISNIKTSKEPINDQYQEILLKQLEDKKEQIKILETENGKSKTLIETKNKEFDKLKEKVSSLFK